MVLRFALFGLIGLHECVAIEWLQDYLYGDRASADSADTKVFRNIYESEEWSRSWYGDLPEDLKNGAMDRGLGYTKDLVELQTGYTVDKVLRQHAGKNLSIVDAGAGGGYMTMELTRIPGWHILALDRSPVCISTAANHMQKHGSDLQKQQAKFRRGDLSRLLLNSASVDVVVAFHVLDQVKDLPRVLKEIHRVLKADGLLVFGVLNRTLWTRMSLWWHTEWLRDRPKELSDWRLGITPSEMKALTMYAGFNMVHEELQGVCDKVQYSVDWAKAPWVLQVMHGGSYSCKDISSAYLGWAYKAPAVSKDADAQEETEQRQEL